MKKIFFVCLLTVVSFSCFSDESTLWQQTLKKVSRSVVSIRVNAVRSFDTQRNMSTQATGFVVDAKRGIILTNRHVVTPGPITAQAVFSNSEEVNLIPIYRDPIHDFGFFQYDPKALKFIEPYSLKLTDSKAKIGDEIKVIGNDSGEHMSILSATLARLDRSAPKYRSGGYNDFNTFYFQSAADTSGGSSGSPVINANAEVLALNAGGQGGSASSYFLPLFKVTRTLEAIQKNQPINRGTLQTTLKYLPFDEVKRLGLSSELEKKFRQHNDGNGLLTVGHTVLGSSADGKLKPGDIIISIKTQSNENQPPSKLDYVTRYEALEIFLDDHVGQEVILQLSRQDKILNVNLKIEDLHRITPDEFIEVSGATFNDFSYQIARQKNLPVKGVYLASPGYMFGNAGMSRGSVVYQLNNKTIQNLDDFQKALSEIAENEYFSVKYVHINSPTNQRVANVKFQTNWHLSRRCQRDDKKGLWPCQLLTWKKESNQLKAAKVKFNQYSDKVLNKISRSLVLVKTALPYQVDGNGYSNYTGTGLVLDAKSGLVFVDRNTVPLKMAQVSITFAGINQVPAKVLFIHPLHSYALIQYDPKLLAGSKIVSAKLNDKKLSPGDTVDLVGYQADNRLIREKLNVSSFAPLTLPANSVPLFRESNTSSLIINNPPLVASGVLLDKKGNVRSWWTNFAGTGRNNQTIDRGLPVKSIIQMRDQWLQDGKIEVFSLEVELQAMSMASARNFALSSYWVNKFQEAVNLPQVFKVSKRVADSDAFNKLQQGDLLLAINHHPIANFDAFDEQIREGELLISIWRDGEQQDIPVTSKRLSGNDTNEIYIWSGALLQAPHRAVSTQYNIAAKGVYIEWYWYGSPANRYGLKPLNRITEFEGIQIESLQQFIALTKQFENKDYVRMRLMDLIGRESIITLKPDPHYWPTQKIFLDKDVWVNRQIN